MDVRIILLLSVLTICAANGNTRCWNIKNGIVCFGKNSFYRKTTGPDGSVQEQMSYSSTSSGKFQFQPLPFPPMGDFDQSLFSK